MKNRKENMYRESGIFALEVIAKKENQQIRTN